MKRVPRQQLEGLISIERELKPSMKPGVLGFDSSKDGRVWICIDGQSVVRFRPPLPTRELVEEDEPHTPAEVDEKSTLKEILGRILILESLISGNRSNRSLHETRVAACRRLSDAVELIDSELQELALERTLHRNLIPKEKTETERLLRRIKEVLLRWD